MPLRVGDIRKDEDRLLRDDNHSLGHLFRQRERTPLRLSWALRLSLQVEAIFLLVLLTVFLPRWDLRLLCLAAAAAIAGVWVATVAALAAGAVKGKLHSRAHRPPMLFWSWWPVWMCLMCCAAAAAAGALCFYLWGAYLSTYQHLAGLEVYERVDPSIVPGLQIQDAGLVDFEEGVDIDRARGGCLVHGGHTYCVAPILHGGRVLDNLGDAPRFGSYDYFAVGVDCCACPNRDFRCGDWRNPMAHGGVRSRDAESRPFYRLAVDEWAATYEKKLGYPIFFDWVDDPARRLSLERPVEPRRAPRRPLRPRALRCGLPADDGAERLARVPGAGRRGVAERHACPAARLRAALGGAAGPDVPLPLGRTAPAAGCPWPLPVVRHAPRRRRARARQRQDHEGRDPEAWRQIRLSPLQRPCVGGRDAADRSPAHPPGPSALRFTPFFLSIWISLSLSI
ncbi:unnamed protein product [Prorocentrum cordatum]|uniref:Uncharacterized protein n=1 Tax=Prorocentrum cordatum TaxID=2364126 RepID=A0ABN9VTG6_9DINO|nr:unnamed protein product [Polarella glacialis]